MSAALALRAVASGIARSGVHPAFEQGFFDALSLPIARQAKASADAVFVRRAIGRGDIEKARQIAVEIRDGDRRLF